MIDSPKVSVLMPSLNVVDYIDECIQSVINQTLKEIEIICIDAGSTDGTLEKLQAYAKQDSRITLLQSPVKSYGHQMNMGLDVARGEYIGIVETDDWVEPCMFEKLYTAAVENNVTVVKSNFWLSWTQENPREELFQYFNGEECGQIVIPSKHQNGSLYGRKPSIWSAIYQREFLEANHIRFLETAGASYQDTSFTFQVFSLAPTMFFLYEALLHYRQDNENSSVNNVDSKISYIFEEYKKIFQVLEDTPENKGFLLPIMLTSFYNTCMWAYDLVKLKTRYPLVKQASTWMRKIMFQINSMGLSLYGSNDKKSELRHIVRDPWGFHVWRAEDYCRRVVFPELEKQRQTARKLAILNQGTDSDATKSTSRMEDTLDKKVATQPKATTEGSDQEKSEQAPMFSVIIPVYNVENFVSGAMQSLVSQNFEDVEFLCVNDGSTDRSVEVLEFFAKQDNRIQIIHKENGGLSSARNAGMRQATGKYICFLDSDDFISEDAFERLLLEINANKPNAICFGTNLFPQNPAPNLWLYQVLSTTTRFYEKISIDEWCTNGNFHVFVWRFCFSSEYLKQYDLHFDENVKFGEDVIFLYSALQHTQGLSVLQDSLYNYRHFTPDSLMDVHTRDHNQYCFNQLTVLKKLLALHGDSEVEPSAVLLEYCCNFVRDSLVLAQNELKQQACHDFLELLEEHKLDSFAQELPEHLYDFWQRVQEQRELYLTLSLSIRKKINSTWPRIRKKFSRVVMPNRNMVYYQTDRIMELLQMQQEQMNLMREQLWKLQEMQEEVRRLTER